MFGVGGGVVIVPLLVLWLGYEQREATGTRLQQIVPVRWITLIFAALLVAVAVGLVV